MSAEREREKGTVRGPVYLACIHMQIPIDMTTFTYCIFALGHILARQFPIVGFRPPVRLIDIIGRAADTRLHFYLHTFANQFEPTPALSLCARRHCTLAVFVDPRRSAFFLLPPTRLDDCPTIFARVSLSRCYTRVSCFRARECERGAGATSIDSVMVSRGVEVAMSSNGDARDSSRV